MRVGRRSDMYTTVKVQTHTVVRPGVRFLASSYTEFFRPFALKIAHPMAQRR